MRKLSALCNADFNPLPPSGGRHSEHDDMVLSKHISIHSLQAEGDVNKYPPYACFSVISIHSLQAEGDRVNPLTRTV